MLLAGDPAQEAQKWEKEAQDQAAKAKAAKAKLDCEKPRASDKKALVKAVKAARTAAENAQKWADQAKADAEKAAITADANPKNDKAQAAKEKADQAAADAQKAADGAKKAYDDALGEAPAMKAAAELEKELDQADVKNNSKKKDIVDRLKKKAQEAAEANPCDPEEVKRQVRVELEKIKKEVSRNGELKPWVDDLAETLKDNHLISLPAGKTDDLIFNVTRTRPADTGNAVAEAPQRAAFLLGGTAQVQASHQAPAFDTDHFDALEKSIYSDPALLEQLFERLGGEFWFGSFSQPGTFGPVSSTPLRMYGLEAVIPIGKFMAIQTAVAQGQFSATSTFPVTVIHQQNGQTRQTEGLVSSVVKIQTAQLAGRAYLFSPGTLQAYAGAGGQYRLQTSERPTAQLEGASWTFGSSDKQTYWDLSGQLGFSIQPRTLPVFLEIGAMLQTPLQPNSGSTVLVWQLAAGWKFGG